MHPLPDHPAELDPAVEAVLFASDRPMSVAEIAEIIGRAQDTIVPVANVEDAIERLRQTLRERRSALDIAEVGAGWELRTRAELAPYVRAMYRRRPARLTRAALEVLAIVAYRQPCTRADVDDIRGVDSAGVLRQLLERGLVKMLGKADDVGRPILYGTGAKFLEFFGLRSLSELPTLREYTELTEEHLVRLQELEDTMLANQRAGEQDNFQQELPDA